MLVILSKRQFEFLLEFEIQVLGDSILNSRDLSEVDLPFFSLLINKSQIIHLGLLYLISDNSPIRLKMRRKSTSLDNNSQRLQYDMFDRMFHGSQNLLNIRSASHIRL